MKHLSDFMNEQLFINEKIIFENVNGELILEGFWSKLAKLFGFGTEKTKKAITNWSKELRQAYIAGQIAASKGDDTIKEIIKEQDKEIEKEPSKLLTHFKNTVKRLIKNWDKLSNKEDISYPAYQQLSLKSEEENDKEGKKLANDLKNLISKDCPDAEKKYNNLQKKIENSDIYGSDKIKKTEVKKEDIEQAITDNKNVLEPLVKALNGKIDGNKLTELVEGLMAKDPVYKGKSETEKTANTIGMAAVICGAAMITSPKCLERVCEWAIDKTDRLTGLIKSDEIKLK